jgi:general secretion pathway protein F
MSAAPPKLDDLVALNQEIAAMVRAGIPLELGLKQHATTWPSRFSAMAERIADRLALGEPLVEALRREGSAFSPAYAAVIEAGLQSGRLSEALERLADLGLTVQEIRRRVWLAATYPLIVAALAYGMFVWFVVFGVPLWTQTREALFLPPRFVFTLLAQLHDTVSIWGPLVPVAFVILVLALRLWTAGSTSGMAGYLTSCLWVPGVGAVYRNLLRAQFARLLAILLEHHVPAERAVALAGESTGDARLTSASEIIAERLQRGNTWGEAVGKSPLPEYLRWMMIVGEKQGALPAVLQQTAGAYQRKAERWLTWVRSVLPVAMVSLFSGLVVTAYCVGLFLPLQQFWYDLMQANP